MAARDKSNLYLADNILNLQEALGNRLPRKGAMRWRNTQKAGELTRQLVNKVKRQRYSSKRDWANRQRRQALVELTKAVRSGKLTPNTVLTAPLPSAEQLSSILQKQDRLENAEMLQQGRRKRGQGRGRGPTASRLLPLALLMTAPSAAKAAAAAAAPSSTALVPIMPPTTPWITTTRQSAAWTNVQQVLFTAGETVASRFLQHLSALPYDQAKELATSAADTMQQLPDRARGIFLNLLSTVPVTELQNEMSVAHVGPQNQSVTSAAAQNQSVTALRQILRQMLPEEVANTFSQYALRSPNGVGKELLALTVDLLKTMKAQEGIEIVSELMRTAPGKGLSILRGVSALGKDKVVKLTQLMPDAALLKEFLASVGNMSFPSAGSVAAESSRIVEKLPTQASRMEFLKILLRSRPTKFLAAMAALAAAYWAVAPRSTPPGRSGNRNVVSPNSQNNRKKEKEKEKENNTEKKKTTKNTATNNNNNNNTNLRPRFDRRRKGLANANFDVPLEAVVGLLGSTVVSGALLLAGGGFGQ